MAGVAVNILVDGADLEQGVLGHRERIRDAGDAEAGQLGLSVERNPHGTIKNPQLVHLPRDESLQVLEMVIHDEPPASSIVTH